MNTLILISTLLSTVSSTLVLYWGQDYTGVQEPLGDYCEHTPGNVYVISFLSAFDGVHQPVLNIKGCYSTFPNDPNTLNCPDIANDIQKCQSLGKMVLLSLGGALWNVYSLDSPEKGVNLAKQVWDLFGMGNAQNRPFGNAVIDGFDLDIEGGANAGYPAFVNELRNLFKTQNQKQFLISAAPQCPYPDLNLENVLNEVDIDWIFIQFYNNYCRLDDKWFNFDTWVDWAENIAVNQDIKLFVGLAGSPSAASYGYVEPGVLHQQVRPLLNNRYFGGISVWDASRAARNLVDGHSYLWHLNSLLEEGSEKSTSRLYLTEQATPPSEIESTGENTVMSSSIFTSSESLAETTSTDKISHASSEPETSSPVENDTPISETEATHMPIDETITNTPIETVTDTPIDETEVTNTSATFAGHTSEIDDSGFESVNSGTTYFYSTSVVTVVVDC